MANILLATLGESPIVVTAMYQLLTEQEHKQIDKVIVLCPKGELVQFGYGLIEDVLKATCEVKQEPLDCDDVNGEAESYTFLHVLYSLLSRLQDDDDIVYLSLAGGRKNMSALMAVLVPLFPCVRGLYHVIDRDEHLHERQTFRSLEKLYNASDSARHKYFSPSLERLILVPIPFQEHQQVSKAFRARLFSVIDEDTLEDLYAHNPDEANTVEFVQDIAQEHEPERMLEVLVTERAAQQFRQLWQQDRTHARGLKYCLERMRFANILRNRSHDTYTRNLGKGEHDRYSQNLASLTFHFFKRGGATERPVFHTVPRDIRGCSNTEVEKVIVSEMEFKRNGKYRSLQEITGTRHFFPLKDFVDLNQLLKSLPDLERESVLIVPLGDTPMIATQLCALLKAEGRKIKEVVLVYPQKLSIQLGAEMLQEAFEDEKIICTLVEVKGRKDIDSREACLDFEQTLVGTIDTAHQKHANCQVELALSGGRKGMAALTMFVAQRKGLHYVYHTLIVNGKNDKTFSEKVERETNLDALSGTRINGQTRNNRLFLREYEGNGPYTRFVLFKVPVLPPEKSY